MSNHTISRVDLKCQTHDAFLVVSEERALLRPNDPYDFSVGWNFDLSWAECPKDANGECCDAWAVIPY